MASEEALKRVVKESGAKIDDSANTKTVSHSS